MSSKHQNSRGSGLVIILSIVAVIVIGGAVAYAFMARKNTATGSVISPAPPKTITATTPDGVKALLTDAMAGKYGAKCSYMTTANDSTSTKSMLYVKSAKKMRVDTPISDKPGHMLWLNDLVYIWADGDSKGSILPVTSSTQSKTYTPDGFSSKVKEYQATCQSVPAMDESLFEKPTNIEFIDFNAQIKKSSYGN